MNIKKEIALKEVMKCECDPYEKLGMAIIAQAVDDYCKATFTLMGKKNNMTIYNAKKIRKECIEFFESSLFDIYSCGKIDGVALMHKLNKEMDYIPFCE